MKASASTSSTKHDGSRVKQVLFCQAEDKPIPRSEIVKGFEYEKDRYVVIEDEEVKKVAPQTAKVMEILEFVKSDHVDPIYFETSYYMAPDEAGEKPYALLFDALKKTGYAGVAKIAMHNREHIVILRPGKNGVLLHTMYLHPRDPPGRRVSHRPEPGEGQRTRAGHQPDRSAGRGVRAGEVQRQLPREPAADDRGQEAG